MRCSLLVKIKCKKKPSHRNDMARNALETDLNKMADEYNTTERQFVAS